MNSVGLTDATEIIDDSYESGDVSLERAFSTAVGADNEEVVR